MNTKFRPQNWEETFARYKIETDHEHDEVVGAGGLHILGTERHEARRIDNQFADVPDARAIPARRASICRWKTT